MGSILIVEDNPDIREALTQVLTLEGYTVATAAHGKEALDYLRSKPQELPKVILLDLMMPVMDGWEFRAIQTADPVLSKIPTLILSADGWLQSKAYLSSAAGYLRKPVQVEKLVELIARHFSALATPKTP